MEVVVVGAVNVDLVVVAPTLPGPGETVVGPGMTRHGGGKGANAAVAAARVGASVRLVGAVGDDDLGRDVLDELRSEGVDVDGVAVLEGTATGTALIVVDAAGENQIAVGAGANGRLDAGRARAALTGALDTAGCLLVSTEIPADAVTAAVHAGVEAGVRCVLNPAPMTDVVRELMAAGIVLTPNAGEAAALARYPGSDATVDAGSASGGGSGAASPVSESVCTEDPDAGTAPVNGSAGDAESDAVVVAARSGAPVVVTLGADGVLVAEPDGTLDRVPAHPAATVRDTTGAGDTFNGVLAARLAAGDGLRAAVRTANVAAALSVAEPGARSGMPRAAEIAAATPAEAT